MSYNASASSVNLEELARDMVTPVKSVEISTRSAWDLFSDDVLFEKINTLSIEEQNELLRIIRNNDRRWVVTQFSKQHEDYIKGLEQYGKDLWKSILQLTEEEIDSYKKYLSEIRSTDIMPRIMGWCRSAYFPDIIYFNEKPDWATEYAPINIQCVYNSADYDKDYELYFNVSSSNITGTTTRARNVLRLFGGKLNKVTNAFGRGDIVIVGASRFEVLYGFPSEAAAKYFLRRDFRIWK